MRIEDSWSALASAIINRAISDRKMAMSMHEKNPENLSALETIRETDVFFSSKWCEELLEISGINTDGATIKELIDEC